MAERGTRKNNPGHETMSKKKNQAMRRTRVHNARRQRASEKVKL